MSESNTTPSQSAIAEIDHGPSKLDQFLDQHTSKLIIAAVVLALAVVAYVVKSGIDEGTSQEAGSSLISAETSDELQNVITKWPGSDSSATALTLLADSQWETDKDKSISTLQKFISENPKHPAVATSKVNLGIKLLQHGKESEAVDILTEVAESDSASYIAPLAAITLGDIAKSSGDLEKATNWYNKAKEDPSEQGNAYAQIAETRLILVNAQPPVKVQPAVSEPAIPVTPTPALPPVPPVPATPEAPTSEPAK